MRTDTMTNYYLMRDDAGKIIRIAKVEKSIEEIKAAISGWDKPDAKPEVIENATIRNILDFLFGSEFIKQIKGNIVKGIIEDLNNL